MHNDRFVMGVDYGTDSVRAVLVDAANGKEIAASVFYYPRWKQGLYCVPSLNQFRQHPLDYIEGLETTIRDCLQKAGAEMAAKVKAISIDTTGSTPVAVNKEGTPWPYCPDLKRTLMRCLYCGKTIRPCRKQPRSTGMPKNLKPIICNM